MSRGFYSTFGTGISNDRVASSGTTRAVNTMSFSAWVWMNGGGAGGNGTILANNSGLVRNGYVQVYTTDTTRFRFVGRGWTTTNLFATWPHAGTGRWQHMVCTYDGSSTANDPIAYVDGLPVTVTRVQAAAGTFTNTASICLVGSETNGNGGGVWDGMIAHAAVWSGVILTAAEAWQLANGISPLQIQPNALACYFPLDGVSALEPDLVGGQATYTSGRVGRSEPPMPLSADLWTLEPRFIGPHDISVIPPTQAQITQEVLEHWTSNGNAVLTQLALEHWVNPGSTNVQAVLTQLALEHWTSVAAAAPPATGNRAWIMA